MYTIVQVYVPRVAIRRRQNVTHANMRVQRMCARDERTFLCMDTGTRYPPTLPFKRHCTGVTTQSLFPVFFCSTALPAYASSMHASAGFPMKTSPLQEKVRNLRISERREMKKTLQTLACADDRYSYLGKSVQSVAQKEAQSSYTRIMDARKKESQEKLRERQLRVQMQREEAKAKFEAKKEARRLEQENTKQRLAEARAEWLSQQKLKAAAKEKHKQDMLERRAERLAFVRAKKEFEQTEFKPSGQPVAQAVSKTTLARKALTPRFKKKRASTATKQGLVEKSKSHGRQLALSRAKDVMDRSMPKYTATDTTQGTTTAKPERTVARGANAASKRFMKAPTEPLPIARTKAKTVRTPSKFTTKTPQVKLTASPVKSPKVKLKTSTEPASAHVSSKSTMQSPKVRLAASPVTDARIISEETVPIMSSIAPAETLTLPESTPIPAPFVPVLPPAAPPVEPSSIAPVIVPEVEKNGATPIEKSTTAEITDAQVRSSPITAHDLEADVVEEVKPTLPNEENASKVDEATAIDYSTYRVVDLQKELKKYNLPYKGRKADLLKRLLEHLDQLILEESF